MNRRLTLALALASFLFAMQTARAAEIIFTINSSLSNWEHSGTDNIYGPLIEQSPGSLTAPVSGHFLVDFDPSTSTPPTLQFIGGHGFFKVASPHVVLPGVGSTGPAAPANGGGRTAGGEMFYAVRDLQWDFDSAPIARSSGIYNGTQSNFIVLSGGEDSTFIGGSDPDGYQVGFTDALTAGDWVLTESPAGSGNWTLTLDGYYDFGYDYGGVAVGTSRSSAVVVSTAQYNVAENEAPVATGETQAEALGGASSSNPGGVSATFSEPVSGGGTLAVQQVPSEDALSQEAIAAAEVNPTFAISTQTLDANPQIWEVDFDGVLAPGSTVELVFAYDETLLPPGTDESLLGIWHFNSNINDWEFGGTVDTVENTVTYVTDNFSPFQLGLVPEPSTLALAAFGVIALAARYLRRRQA